MEKLTNEQVKELQDKFLNKNISVMENNGKITGGLCTFIGYNEFIPSWGLQVTLSRTPVTNFELKSIKLI